MFNIQALHSFVKVTLFTIMDMVVNYYGQKYAERSYGYKYLLHKRVPNPLKSRCTISGLENRALTRFESEVTRPPHKGVDRWGKGGRVSPTFLRRGTA